MAPDEQVVPAATSSDDTQCSHSTRADEPGRTVVQNEQDAPVASPSDTPKLPISDSVPEGSPSGHAHAPTVGLSSNGPAKGPRTEKRSGETDRPSETSIPDDSQLLKSWAQAHDLHRKGFIQLVREKRPKQSDCGADDSAYGYRVSISEMQRMYMRALQIQLADKAVRLQTTPAIRFSGNTPMLSEGSAAGTDADLQTAQSEETIRRVQESLGPLLCEYIGRKAQAVRDYKYMEETQREAFDYFIITSERINDQTVMSTVLGDLGKGLEDLFRPKGGPGVKNLQEAKENAIVARKEKYEKNPKPLGGAHDATAKKMLRKGLPDRLLAAAGGTVYLIGPMWVLVLNRDLYIHLVFVTVCVLVFSLMMAITANSMQSVFAPTVAYAAVLVVFVGVSLEKSLS